MDLFNEISPNANLLPYDGTVRYLGTVMTKGEADAYYNVLLNDIEWENDEAIIFGKRIVTKRKVAWYGDSDFGYTYSGTTKRALQWTTELRELKMLAEQQTGSTYNSCLLNLYHDGSEGMAWHSDAEKDLVKEGAIASVSLGAERKFLFKHKVTGQKVQVLLQHGSILIMEGTTQTHWLHRLPPSTLIKTPRVNLTFRSIRK